MRPKLSVVMSVYNAVPHLRNAVASTLSQTLKDFEFIIVDDFSTDSSYSELLSFTRKDSRIRLYRNSYNVGLTRSLNRAMQYVTTPIVARMDADDISELYRLQIQYDYLTNTDCTLLGSDAVIIDDNSKVLKVKKRLCDYSAIQFYALFNNPFMHTSVMFKKECYDLLGGYNNRVVYAQDYDLWARWIQKYKAENINRPLVKWRQSRKGISSNKTRQQMLSADGIVVKYVRSAFPELCHIEDKYIADIRNSRFNYDNISLTDEVLLAAIDKFSSSYALNWVAAHNVRTKCFRR